jgi:hypothetical protein
MTGSGSEPRSMEELQVDNRKRLVALERAIHGDGDVITRDELLPGDGIFFSGSDEVPPEPEEPLPPGEEP